MSSETKKIAWLHSHFLLWAGGTKFVYEVARRVNKHYPIDMFVEKCSDEVRKLYERESITVYEINSLSSRSKWYWLFFPLFLHRNTSELSKIKSRYPLFISSMFPMHSALYRAGISRYLVYLFEPFAFFHDREMIAGFPFLKRTLLKFLSKLYAPLDIEGVRKAAGVLTVNDGTARWIKSIYGVDAALTNLATDPDFFDPEKLDRERVKQLEEKYRGRKVIIHSTDFTPLKRTGEAVRLMKDLKTAIPEALLVITQSVTNEDEIRHLKTFMAENGLERHVEFAGHLTIEELPYFYARADMFLYTGIGSGASAASLFVLECMAAATPGVRTDFTKDEIAHGVSGYLYRPDDYAALLKFSTDLLKNDTEREKFGRAARETILRKYSWDTVAESIVGHIKRNMGS